MHESHAELLRSVAPSALGARLRAARTAAGLTQARLAGTDYSPGYVSRIESGARRPTLTALTEFASRVGTPVEQLLRGVSASEYDEIRLGLDYAELALENGETTDAERQAREGLTQAELASLEEFVARGHYLLGRACEAQGRLDDAVRELERAVDTGSGLLTIHAAIALSRCHREAGDLTLAIETGERVQAALPDLGLDATDEAVQLAVTVAAAYAERGDLSQAARICEDAVQKAEKLSSPRARSAAYWNASMLHAERGHARDAVPLASRALALLSEGQSERHLAVLRLELGQLMMELEPPRLTEAIEHISRGRQDLGATSATAAEIARADVHLAEAHLLSGDAPLAAEIAGRVETSLAGEATLVRVQAMVIRGQAAAIMGRTSTAEDAYRDAETLLSAMDSGRASAQLWFDLAQLFEQSGDLEAAREAFKKAAGATGLAPRLKRRTTGDIVRT